MDGLFQSFEPGDSRHGRRFPRLARVPLRVVLPNVVTLVALCAGLTAIRMAMESRWEWAIQAILLAAVLDAVDGRVARLIKGTSRFGAELDSLADFVNFGVAPGIVLYAWLLSDIGTVGWAAALVFAIAAALRLARFNVMAETPRPDWQTDFFVGMPSPAGALVVMLPLYLAETLGFSHWRWLAPVVALYVGLVALLMVSRIPTFSGKRASARLQRDHILPIFVVAVAVMALAVSYPMPMLAIASIVYLGSIPVVWRWHQRLARGAALPAQPPATAEPSVAPPLN